MLIKKCLFQVGVVLACLLGLGLPCSVDAQQTKGFSLANLQHKESAFAQWWNMPAAQFMVNEGGLGQIEGRGRIFLSVSKKPLRIEMEGLSCTAEPDSMLFLDKVERQVRLMVLHGEVKMHDGIRAYKLLPSMQVVRNPEPNNTFFINDGIYRRPPIHQFKDPDRKTFVRQFYLEQVTYTDPILRHLYQQGSTPKRLIDKINKTGAVLRTMNGTSGYVPNQV